MGKDEKILETESFSKIDYKICPTCGCSLVRLGIKENSSTKIEYQKNIYFFCCSGCATMFRDNPIKYIQEINNVIICPVCLAEKNINQTVDVKYNDIKIPFCRCSHCASEFQNRPQYYIDRLSGKVEYDGLFKNLCC